MRVSTSMIFNNGTNGIQNRQSDLYKIQNQLSTGRKVLSPEDDPIAASEALQISQSKGVNDQFLENQANAQSQLGFLDSILEGVGNEFARIQELTVQAGNGSYSANQRGMIAAELKERMANLIGLANTRDGTGLYIFGGYQSNTKPFQEMPNTSTEYSNLTGSSVTYNGDAGQASLQVSMSKEIAVSENGIDVFMQVKGDDGSVSGRSMFDGLQNLINALEEPVLDGTKYQQALGDMNSVIGHVATVRASVGARMNSLDGLSSAGGDVAYLYDVRLSELQDLDYANAISKFANYKMQLEAAQLSFKQSSQLSLFNIL